METKQQKLPVEFKEKWIAALRSGDYKQGSSYLCLIENGPPEYCCLGVACHVAGIPNDKMNERQLIDRKWKTGKVVPDILRGLISNNPIVDTLTTMNDGDFFPRRGQKSFSEIADWIEENL